MLDRLPRAVINQTRGFMILMGYLMALTAFFVTLAQIGEITPAMRAMMWALMIVPMAHVLAVSVESITREREHT